MDSFEVPEKSDGVDMLTLNVQIPLKKEAIQISLVGPAAKRKALIDLRSSILVSLEGESNWIEDGTISGTTETERRTRLIGIAIVIFVIGCIVYWQVSQKANKGTLLVLAVMVWISGSLASSPDSRTSLMVSGTLKLLGTLGIILGIVDLTRKRKPAHENHPENDTSEAQ